MLDQPNRYAAKELKEIHQSIEDWLYSWADQVPETPWNRTRIVGRALYDIILEYSGIDYLGSE